MSMFHELMMRKKEQIMYATIKGSLTENDGVFSGFSDNNYLEMQQAIPNLDVNSFLEIELKVTMPETITRQQIVGTNNANYTNNSTYDIGFQVYDDNRLWAHIYNSTSETRNAIYLTAPSALNGKVCYIKYTIANSRMTISLSFDKITWVSNYYDLPTTFSYTKASRSVLGWGNGSSAFAGSIDLSNSYIKLGSTKYNLQAVVGYTIVGSPTITDGVVSGFSNSDYLKLPSFDFANSNSWKIKFAFELDNNISDWGSIFDNSYIKSGLAFYLDNNQKVYFYGGDGTNDTFIKRSNIINANQKYYVQVEFTGNSYILSLSTDNINWTIVNTTESNIRLSNTIYDSSYIGYSFRYNGRALIGKIYIKECLIYKDKKLWFNGYER